MMQLSEEQLNEVEMFAGRLADIQDIADILEVDVSELTRAYQDKTHPFYKRYRKGFLMRYYELLDKQIVQALQGSSPAQMMVNEHLQRTTYKTMIYER